MNGLVSLQIILLELTMYRTARKVALAVFFGALACSRQVTVTPTPAPAPSAAAVRQLPNDIRWMRVSAEYRALARQAFRIAEDRLPTLSNGLPRDRWAVILDADETVLDNSLYARRRVLLDSGYTESSWDAWVRERAATPIPGAVDFLKRVHALGGRVVVVTNRAERLCDPTRDNLKSVGIEADLVLCQPPGESDKNPRFERVQKGTASQNVPPLTVVAWFGDNIQDFPGMTQAVRDDPRALAEFGTRYFILPNPNYGSWQQVREP